MDWAKRELKGSPKRDEFKRKHKDLNKRFYASDADLCLISKHPPGIVAYLDYKGSNESVTFAEAILYNVWVKHAPVYIVEGRSPEDGPFVIRSYLKADWHPNPPKVTWGKIEKADDWQAFGQWEQDLRDAYHRHGGWGFPSALASRLVDLT